jgi:hypothetical protein
MTLAEAMRWTEILMALAFVQQSLEHLHARRDGRMLYALRLLLCVALLAGWAAPWACLGLVILALFILQRFAGPYNGGSDRMSLLILCCLTLAEFMSGAQDLCLGYLAMQLVLSYVMSGWVKIVNPQWRSGLALRDVFAFSAYPVGENLRGWARYPRLLWAMSWGVMSFELLFPLSLWSRSSLIAALLVAALFHGANACLLGLNRFFWIWLAAYPSILWLQDRVLG